MNRRIGLLVSGGLLVLTGAADLHAQNCACSGSTLPAFVCGLPGTVQTGSGCGGSLKACQTPVIDRSRIDVVPESATTVKARLVVDVTAPWNSDSRTPSSAKLQLFWTQGDQATHPTTSLCQKGDADHQETYLEYGNLSCTGGPYDLGTFSLRALVCSGAGSCQKITDVNGLQFVVTNAMLKSACPEPPKSGCNVDLGCTLCLRAGRGAASPAGQGAAANPAGSGPQAYLYYRAGGAGGPNWPGTAAWNVVLGRYWSHDYAERIVQDPGLSHVWLITRFATFREFTDSNADGVYETVSPSDEKRTLRKVTSGWELRDLDQTVQSFDNSGLWTQTVDRNGNAKVAAYTGGILTQVSLPDGRREDFTYLNGKLRTITEVGVGGSPSRTWTYTWNGLDLTRIDRPDGTALAFSYSTDPNLGGYMTRMDLIGSSGGTGRVETAWEYDIQGNVTKIWRGDPVSTGPAAVDLYTLVYDNPSLPSHTDVTDALGKVSSYDISRDSGSQKPKVTRISGDCPTCGTGPNAVLEYTDSTNPLLPTAQVDGRLLHTEFTYNADGQITRKLEAMGTALQRDTNWQYHATFRAFPIHVDVPSTSGGAARRETSKAYDAQGNLLTSTIQGAESGSAFTYTTVTTYNAGGQPLTLDPPGHGTADMATFTYDATRGNGFLIPLSRTDPLVGTTTYTYDAFNRRTEITDPNTVKTVTAYDDLDRVASVTQKGDPAASIPDLVTTYLYTPFGDLFRTILPEGSVIEYGYDGAGRLVSIERKPDATTPGERTLYTLDAVGHRVKEELQRQVSGVWTTESKTDFVYSTRCHLDKVIRPDGTVSGAVTEYAYDCNGNLAKVWDANHPSQNQTATATQTYTYDTLDRMSTLTQPWAGAGGGTAVTSYGYDVQDHLTQVTDAESNATTYTYSDRDLLTQQASPVSGMTTYGYDEHGELTSEIDARGVAVSRTLDVLSRITAVTYPDPNLNVTYTYDAPGSFAKGRLTGITRNGQTVSYVYDRFGRTLQDGDLTFTYDKNGNQKTIGYPDSITATYTYDFADRQQSLSVKVGTNPSLSLVNGATYKPFGPLSSLPLGNGLTETRSYDQRYSPDEIRVDGPTSLRWSYATDALGNITAINDLLEASNNRSYGYQDVSYFLTQGNGPWGTRAWTYDRIGNRLSESRGAVTDSYSYLANAAGGHNPKLLSIALGAGGTRTFGYDESGNTVQIVEPTQQLDLVHDAADRLAVLRSLPVDTASLMTYDGREYLREASDDGAACAPQRTVASYSSEGLLYRRAHFDLFAPAAPALDSEPLFYFAGRPVATLKLAPGGSTLTFLTTDHLGTPILATRDTGALVWKGGFEPFGADWNGAEGAGVFLRFPGQWADGRWGRAGNGLFYNVSRWYQPGTGLYITPDPVGIAGDVHLYSYAWRSPINWGDPNGLSPRPLPPSRQKPRPCTPEERERCVIQCGPKGVESCMVSRTWGLVRSKERFELWKWVDGPMSCSCHDVDPLLERCIRTFQTIYDVLQWMADHPPHMPPLPLPAPVPLPVPVQVPL